MSTVQTLTARLARRTVYASLALTAVGLVLGAGRATGQEIVKVEEDWQLVVSQPDPQTFAPQVTTTISPGRDLGSYYAVFDVNLRNLPSYEAGGVQFQLWSGNTALGSKKSNTGTLLQVPDETVTWTQRLSVSEGNLVFEIANGNSQTWGNFGPLTFTTETDLTNLSGYSPAVSVANSAVGYAANRVTSLKLTAVRAYSAAGLVGQSNTALVVYPHD